MTNEEIAIFNGLLKENEQLRNFMEQQERFHQEWKDHAENHAAHTERQTIAMESIATSLADLSNRPYLNASK